MAVQKPLVSISGQTQVLPEGDTIPIAAIASGTPDGTKYVRDDGVLATPAGGSAAATPDFLIHAQGII